MPEVESPRPAKMLTGMKKVSVLLVALGADVTSSILQQLTPDEMERIAAEIMLLKRIDPEVRRQVISECRRALGDDSEIVGAEYARMVLQQVVGESKAKEVLSRLNTSGGMSAFRWLRTVPARQLSQSLRSERAQVIALVLGHLNAEQAAEVLGTLPEQIQGEVALRLTTMQPTDPEVVKTVAEILLQRLSSSESATFTEVGGNKSVVKILNNVDRSTEKKIIEYLSTADEAVANEIKESMFVFEDILTLDDRSIQIILRDVPQEDLRLGLKGAADNVKDVFFRNMSQRAVETLKEDLEASGPVKLRDVEGAQGRIAAVARQLDEAGEISLRDTGEELVA